MGLRNIRSRYSKEMPNRKAMRSHSFSGNSCTQCGRSCQDRPPNPTRQSVTGQSTHRPGVSKYSTRPPDWEVRWSRLATHKKEQSNCALTWHRSCTYSARWAGGSPSVGKEPLHELTLLHAHVGVSHRTLLGSLFRFCLPLSSTGGRPPFLG